MKRELQEKFNDYLETLQNCNRSFLIGAGCSKCANLPLTGELTTLLDSKLQAGKPKEILNYVMGNFLAAPGTTIEEYISEIVDYGAILERRMEKGTLAPTMHLNGRDYTVQDFRSSISEIQKFIVEIIEGRDFDLATHINFISSIHYRLDNGKLPSEPTNYFVLNYDNLIEDALSMNKVNYADGFRGGAIGWWDVSAFSDINIKARLFKLHGSLDWCISKDDTMPRRLKSKSRSNAYNFDEHVLIYPCATKYKETQNDPFSQLLGRYRDLLQKTEKAVLTICGYRFADSHINIEIEKALAESKNLTVIIFSEIQSPDEHSLLKSWYKNKNYRPNLKFFMRNGYYHNDDVIEAEAGTSLEWWKFEDLTKLLNS